MDNANLKQLIVKEGMEYSFEDMLQYLHEAGYLRVSRVTQQGYYSVKGGIIQLYPFGSKEAITFDYFGDQIELIKSSRGKLSFICIRPLIQIHLMGFEVL